MKFEKYIYKKKIKELPQDLLPREKALKYGFSSLSEGELLAISLGSGTKGLNVLGLADKIIKKYGIDGLREVSLEELTKIKGIGISKALQILAIIELANRINSYEEKIELSSPKQVVSHIKFLRNESQEKLVCLYTNTLNYLISQEVVAVGSMNLIHIKPRDIFYYAIKHNAYGIILAHNHPQGEAYPSKEDIEFTNLVKKLALELGFEVLDHIIINKNSYYSFAENGII